MHYFSLCRLCLGELWADDLMRELISNIINKLEHYSINQIEITDYCRKKMFQRNINEILLVSTLFSKNAIYYAKEQIKFCQGKSEKRHKLIFKISSRYSLIIIIAFYPNILKVINVIKTSKDMEKKWKEEILK